MKFLFSIVSLLYGWWVVYLGITGKVCAQMDMMRTSLSPPHSTEFLQTTCLECWIASQPMGLFQSRRPEKSVNCLSLSSSVLKKFFPVVSSRVVLYWKRVDSVEMMCGKVLITLWSVLGFYKGLYTLTTLCIIDPKKKSS